MAQFVVNISELWAGIAETVHFILIRVYFSCITRRGNWNRETEAIKSNMNFVGFEVSTAVTVTIAIHREVLPYSLVEVHRKFGGTYFRPILPPYFLFFLPG
jgi:hypothetical protein